MQIDPITHPGHTTTYTYEVTDEDGTKCEINASNVGGVMVHGRPGGPHRFANLKSALNFALGAPD